MRSASYSSSSYHYRASWRSRLTAWTLTLASALLVLFMLWQLGVIPPLVPEPKDKPITLQIEPKPVVSPTPAKKMTKTKKASGGASPHHPTPAPRSDQATSRKPTPPAPWNVIPLSSQEFAAADISKMPSHHDAPTPAVDGADGAGAGDTSGSAYGPGEGPNGERVYNAEWYVKPTDAQMNFYMPHNAQSGSADVVCKTIAHYHVEDCRELGESPPGSGFSRAVREAAWQFLVRPPRVGGHEQIGAWVHIHYDFHVRSVADADHGN